MTRRVRLFVISACLLMGTPVVVANSAPPGKTHRARLTAPAVQRERDGVAYAHAAHDSVVSRNPSGSHGTLAVRLCT
jgi:hypothetical protein